nr:uncharacterized protein LOC104210114 [Ipomoea batatas]
MGKKSSGFSLFGLFKSKKAKKVWNGGEDYPRDEVFVNKAYKVWPSDEDRGIRWVAEPGINWKARAFIDGKTKDWKNPDATN